MSRADCLHTLLSWWETSLFLLLNLVFLAFPSVGIWFLLAELLGLSIAGLLTHMVVKTLTRQAESKRTQPNNWFCADAEREREIYGRLRAHRLFGHALGPGRT